MTRMGELELCVAFIIVQQPSMIQVCQTNGAHCPH